jgi:hypothetical protein
MATTVTPIRLPGPDPLLPGLVRLIVPTEPGARLSHAVQQHKYSFYCFPKLEIVFQRYLSAQAMPK